MITPTPITSADRIDFVTSPKHINISHFGLFNTAIVKLYVWSGALTTTFLTPTVVLKKKKVSGNDNYISFEIGQYIKPHINPTILFDSGITSSNEGVFYQYEVQILRGETLITTQNSETRYATLGYNWDYEDENSFTDNRGSFGFEENSIPKYYDSRINYFKGTINYSGVYNTADMILRSEDVPESAYVRCSKEPYLIMYLNKQGLWDYFTPNGKVVISNKINRETFNRRFRNPLTVNRQMEHSVVDYNIESKQTYTINTGHLKEEMGQLVEEILYSPKVYLIHFKGDIESVGGGITVDTTLYSADNTIITADNFALDTGVYDSFKQIPVRVLDTDFTRKTRFNDKNKVNYNIKFEATYNKINNIV